MEAAYAQPFVLLSHGAEHGIIQSHKQKPACLCRQFQYFVGRAGWAQDREFPASLDYPTAFSPGKGIPDTPSWGDIPNSRGFLCPGHTFPPWDSALTPLSLGLRPLRDSKEVSLVATTLILEALHSFHCQESFLPLRNPSAAAQPCLR